MTHTHTGADTYKELYTWLLRAPLFPAQSCFSAALVKGKNLLPLCPRRLFLLRRFLIQIRITIKPDLSSAFVSPRPFFFSFCICYGTDLSAPVHKVPRRRCVASA